MNILIFFFVLSLMVLWSWFALKRRLNPGIVFMTDGAFFKRNKILVRYNSVLKIERDIPFSLAGRNQTTSFVITYLSGDGMTNSLRYYMKLQDKENWGLFKRKVLTENPAVEFDQSIF